MFSPAAPGTRRAYDVIVFGATGFTGRLVAEYLLQRYGAGVRANAPVRWAMAGRSMVRLEQVRTDLGMPAAFPLHAVDAHDTEGLAQLVAQTKVVISTVGPYQLYGEELVTVCALNGTDYVDLCGEPGWMARMIPRLQEPAARSGARIVFSCGFDSIPFDLGVVYLQAEARRRLQAPLHRVHGRVMLMKGGFSGGTAASLLATLEQAQREPDLARVLADPFALTPGFTGPPQPDDNAGAEWDELTRAWSVPFVMAPINTKNVHRTNALRGHPWGTDFIYSERMQAGRGTRGAARAQRLARTTKLQNSLLNFAPTRALIRRLVLPRPGQGPSRLERESGCYELRFTGLTASGQTLRVRVAGDRDPGYGSTCRLISEAALCLITEITQEMAPGGVWTPGAAMGLNLVRRLQARAGLVFTVD